MGAIRKCITSERAHLLGLFAASRSKIRVVLRATEFVAHDVRMRKVFPAKRTFGPLFGLTYPKKYTSSHEQYCNNNCDGGLHFLVHNIFPPSQAITIAGSKQTDVLGIIPI